MSQIDPSPHDAGTAWVAIDRHANDDVKPYIYVTTDYGKTWKKIVNGIPEGAFVRAVREDPVRKGLLFAATETGMYWSKDSGANWASLQLNFPTVPVHDLVIKDNDLALATHGRAFWILDDISPLRQATDEIKRPISGSTNHPPLSASTPPTEKGIGTAGDNPPAGAFIYAFTRTKPKHATLEILDSSGKVIRTLSSDALQTTKSKLDPEDEKPKPQLEMKAGLNRLIWDLRYEGALRVPDYYLYEYEAGSKGPFALPVSTPSVSPSTAKHSPNRWRSNSIPVSPSPPEDLEKQFTLLIDIRSQLTRVYSLANQVIDLRKQISEMKQRLGSNLSEAQALDEKLEALQKKLINTEIHANEDSLKFGMGVDGGLADLAMIAGGDADAVPTEASIKQFAKVKAEVDGYADRWSQNRLRRCAQIQSSGDQHDKEPARETMYVYISRKHRPPAQIETPRGIILTSIFKSPVSGRIPVRGHQLVGDQPSRPLRPRRPHQSHLRLRLRTLSILDLQLNINSPPATSAKT